VRRGSQVRRGRMTVLTPTFGGCAGRRESTERQPQSPQPHSRRDRARRLGVLMVLLLAAAVGTPSASLAATRITSVALAAPGGESPSLAVEPNGATVLLWQTHVLLSANSARGSVWTATLGRRARHWSQARLVYRPTANTRPNGASVVADSDGSVIALWTMRTNRYGSLWVAVRPPGASAFPPPTELVQGGANHDVQSAQTIVDGSGQLNVIWYDGSTRGQEPYLQTRPVGRKAWTDPTAFFSGVGGAVSDISPVTTADGESFVISDSAGDYVAVPHPRGGSWETPEPIWSFQGTGTPFSPVDPVGQASGTGTIAAAWAIFDGSTGVWQLMTAVRNTATRWQSPAVLDRTRDANFNYIYRMAADTAGHFTVVTPSSSGDLTAYTSDPAGANWSPSVVTNRFSANDWFNVISDGRGDAAVLFERIGGASGVARLFITIRRHDSARWSKPALLSGQAYQSDTDPGFSTLGLPFFIDNDPVMAATARRVLVVWSEGSRFSSQALRSASVPW
jgi:hypothetical protein